MAVPLVRGTVPSKVPLASKLTVPEGKLCVAESGGAGRIARDAAVTVAVRVKAWPVVAGFGVATSVSVTAVRAEAGKKAPAWSIFQAPRPKVPATRTLSWALYSRLCTWTPGRPVPKEVHAVPAPLYGLVV